MQKVILKKGRERPVIRGHPWIFSGAVDRIEEGCDSPAVVDIFDSQSHWIARGLCNPKSQIRVRILTWKKEEIDKPFLTRRIFQAAALRENYLSSSTNSYRLVNGEGDFLPGLVVDRYADFLVCQFFTAGMEYLKGIVIDSLFEIFPVTGIYERSEGGVREEEGLPPAVGVLIGIEPPELIEIQEHDLKFLVNVRGGQKTGFFLDQRDNRRLLSSLARDKTVLNCFAYTGAFAAYALKGGAKRVVSVDSSRRALELATRNVELNGFSIFERDFLKADVFSFLKACQDEFDIVVLDPPSLAPRRADADAASGGYKFLNLHVLRLIKVGGFLFTFCCSQHVSLELFQKIVFGTAVDAGRKIQLVKRLGHPMDHPISLHHPEGEYLKGLLLRVLE